MKNLSRPLLLPLLLLTLIGVIAAGCASQPKARSYGIRFEIDPALASSSIQIDIIGANAVADLPKWENYSVTTYWQPGNAMRRNADKATLEFGLGRNTVQTFDNNDPRWQRWLDSGALHLVILADLPGVPEDQPGNADPRRLILPLDARQWPRGVSTVELRIQESGIKLLTPMRSKPR